MWFGFHSSGLTVSALWMRPHEVCFRKREREKKKLWKTLKAVFVFVFLLVAFIFSFKSVNPQILIACWTWIKHLCTWGGNRDFVRSGPVFTKLSENFTRPITFMPPCWNSKSENTDFFFSLICSLFSLVFKADYVFSLPPSGQKK